MARAGRSRKDKLKLGENAAAERPLRAVDALYWPPT